MSYLLRRAVFSRPPIHSIQCTRLVSPVVTLPITTPFRRNYAAHQAEESYDAFNERYEKFFYGANDKFEVQRGLNNVFAYDLVPSVKVCEAALRACRRVADYSTSVRIFEALREKTENKTQYDAYVNELKPVREELGILLKEEMWPGAKW